MTLTQNHRHRQREVGHDGGDHNPRERLATNFIIIDKKAKEGCNHCREDAVCLASFADSSDVPAATVNKKKMKTNWRKGKEKGLNENYTKGEIFNEKKKVDNNRELRTTGRC